MKILGSIPHHFFIFVSILASQLSFSQFQNDSISAGEISEMVKYLSHDKLKGRVNFSKEQLTAASYISNQFKQSGLQPYPGFTDFYQPFAGQTQNNTQPDVLKWNKKKLKESAFILLSPSLNTTSKKIEDFKIINAGAQLPDSILFTYWEDNVNILLWRKTKLENGEGVIPKNIIVPAGSPLADILIVADLQPPQSIKLSRSNKNVSSVLYNVIGVLPGKSKQGEAVLFSAHYDHVDIDEKGNRGAVFNGANDNASGTTAIMMLAKYFAMRNDNERTLIFCAFAGEEIGLLGSKAFIKNLIPENIVANINVEMIGRHGFAGKNAFFITGQNFSNLKEILINNIKIEGFALKPEPSTDKNLFFRSDNYSFACMGIVAHSIMSSTDDEPCYHQPCDDASAIDNENMAIIIKAIAQGCKTIIAGNEWPVMIDKSGKKSPGGIDEDGKHATKKQNQ